MYHSSMVVVVVVVVAELLLRVDDVVERSGMDDSVEQVDDVVWKPF
jgi:hypothetical protein